MQLKFHIFLYHFVNARNIFFLKIKYEMNFFLVVLWDSNCCSVSENFSASLDKTQKICEETMIKISPINSIRFFHSQFLAFDEFFVLLRASVWSFLIFTMRCEDVLKHFSFSCKMFWNVNNWRIVIENGIFCFETIDALPKCANFFKTNNILGIISERKRLRNRSRLSIVKIRTFSTKYHSQKRNNNLFLGELSIVCSWAQ